MIENQMNNTKKIKDYEPSFKLFQSEVERIMYQMNDVINGTSSQLTGNVTSTPLSSVG